ncbi:RDD family protein [Streptomyces albidochromogenes]|uniref:RDD family protein n=1 Tax=Streptomyces albidochromogenes TaxID=329524 RepID=A0ABW6FRS7_9ACTN
MSAPTPASGDSSPTPGYYPDPSIPGYVRFWNGASWVPGTSRPAPADGEGMPAAPAGAAAPAPAPVPAVEETGPVFFDEEPEGAHLHGNTPEPASAWQADTSRQTGFGGDRDRRVSWGSTATPAADGTTPSAPGDSGGTSGSAPGGSADPRRASGDQRRGGGGVDLRRTGGSAPEPAPAAAGERDPRGAGDDPSGGALPGVRTPGRASPPDDGTVTIRALRRGGAESPRTARADGTMAIRTMTPGANRPQLPDQDRPATPGRTQPPGQGHAAGQGRAATQGRAPGQGQVPGQGHVPGQAQPSGQGQAPGRPQPAAQGHAPAQGQVPGQAQAPHAAGPGQAAGQGHAAAQGTPAAQPAGPGGAVAAPVSAGAGGGAASWAQQVHQLAQPDQEEAGAPPVVPWKPPVSDPFLQAAQAQAAARPAGLAKRLAARLIDTVVLGAAVGAIAVPLVSAALAHIDDKIEAAKLSGETVTVWLLDGTTAGYLGIVLGAYLLLGVVYEVLPTVKWGRTLGKKLCRMHVRDIEAHEPPTFGPALRRWLVYGVLGVLAIGIVNAAWCLFDRPWRQCWHDKAARTFVAGD